MRAEDIVSMARDAARYRHLREYFARDLVREFHKRDLPIEDAQKELDRRLDQAIEHECAL